MSAPPVDINAELTYREGTIKVKEKLVHVNANVGAEGTADFYMCELLSDDGELLAESILCIFIARFEEFTCKLVARHPEKYTDAEDAINEMLASVSRHYMAHCEVELTCLNTEKLH